MALVAAVGCGEGVQPDQREVVYFTAVETDTPEPEVVEDPGSSVDPSQVTRSKPIVNGFIENHERLLAEDEIQRQIGRLERIFMATGDYHHFVAILRDDFELRGAESRVADRYAWALIRMGQRQAARKVLDALLAARPAEATVHFLDGAYWLQEQPREADDVRKTIDAWRRTLALDPAFRGFDVTAQMLEGEIAALEPQAEDAPATSDDDPGSARELAEALVKQAASADAAAEPQDEAADTAEPDAENTSEEAVDPPDVVAANDGTTPTPEAASDTPSEAPDRNAPMPMAKQYRILVAKGEIALSQSAYEAAEQSFVQARAIKPNAFAAEFGQLQALWGKNEDRNEVANRLRRLAEKSDLTPQQRVDLGTFLWTKMARKDLAQKLFEAAKAADPSLATDVDALLDQMAN